MDYLEEARTLTQAAVDHRSDLSARLALSCALIALVERLDKIIGPGSYNEARDYLHVDAG